jgi:hypothetical protein
MLTRRIFAAVNFGLGLVAICIYVASFLRPTHRRFFFGFLALDLFCWTLTIWIGRNRYGENLGIFPYGDAAPWLKASTRMLLAFCVLNIVPLLLSGTPLEENGRTYKKTLDGKREIGEAEYRFLEANEERFFCAVLFSLNAGLGLTLLFQRPTIEL